MSSLYPLATTQAAVAAQPPCTADDIGYIVACCCNDPSLLLEAARLIRPEYFRPNEEAVGLLFQAVIESRRLYNTVSPHVVLRLLRESLQAVGTPLPPEFEEWLLRPDSTGLAYSAVTTKLDRGSVQLGRDLLQRFLHERSVYDPLRGLVATGSPHAIPNVAAFLGDMQTQLARVRSMQEIPCREIAPARSGDFRPSSVFSLTGVPFVDEPLQGQREGDCNGFLGVQTAGKTTWGIHLATECAKTSYTNWRESDPNASGRPRLTVFVTYEESQAKLEPRVWSAAFRISYQRLQRMNSWDELTTPDRMLEYEHRVRQDNGQTLSEAERYDIGRQWLNQTFAVLDHSGSGEFPNAGGGGVDELTAVLRRVQEMREQRLHTVVIDYAGIMIERHMQAAGKDERERRTALKYLGLALKQQVAEQFGCTVWLLHQIKGDANKFSPARLMHHSDAAETRDFSENMAVCGCLGVPDPKTGCRRLNWSKVRYMPGQRIQPYTLRINEDLALLEDVTRFFSVDERSGTFLASGEQRTLGGSETLTSRRGSVGGGPAATLANVESGELL